MRLAKLYDDFAQALIQEMQCMAGDIGGDASIERSCDSTRDACQSVGIASE